MEENRTQLIRRLAAAESAGAVRKLVWLSDPPIGVAVVSAVAAAMGGRAAVVQHRWPSSGGRHLLVPGRESARLLEMQELLGENRRLAGGV